MSVTTPEPSTRSAAEVPFREALGVWLKVGCLSFGGAAAQIAMLHRIVVDEKKWVDEPRFLHALNFCMLLPGPEAQQLATYLGWLMHGVRGGIVAGLLFVLPGALVMLALTLLYLLGQGYAVVDGIFFGIKAAVLAIVVEALIRIGRRALKTRVLVGLAAAAFAGILLLELPFPLLVVGAAAIGFGFARAAPAAFAVPASVPVPVPAPPGRWRTSAVAAAGGLAVWWAPVLLAVATLGAGHVLVDLALFFSKLAVVTFGGAYALLAWLAQQAVEAKGWLAAAEMVDGLGLAETTPGPTILVTQFVGTIAAFRAPAPFEPVTAAVLGAAMTTWVTFAPSFLWIFAGAPYVDDLRSNPRLAGALSAITAAVVGVILYLAVWFALHVLFGRVGEVHAGPLRMLTIDPFALDWRAALLGLVAALLVFRFHVGLIATVGIMAALGVGVRFLT